MATCDKLSRVRRFCWEKGFAMEWQDIATAPRSGDSILAFKRVHYPDPKGGLQIGDYTDWVGVTYWWYDITDPSIYGWVSTDEFIEPEGNQPTHWTSIQYPDI